MPKLSVQQFAKVFDCTNHLACVGVLIVIPGNNLHLIQAVAQLGHHRLRGVEEGTVTDADDIRGNDLILIVAKALGSGSLHRGVDAFLGDVLALDNSGENRRGAGRNRNALRGADELAVELRDNQANCLGGAGGVRHNVSGAGTSPGPSRII